MNILQESLPGGVVLQMNIVSVFTDYHYLTAVTSPNLDFVDIYQSYGSSVCFNRFRISIEEFKRSLNLLGQIYENVEKLNTYNTLKKNKITEFIINQKQELKANILVAGLELENTLNHLPLRSYIQGINRGNEEDEDDLDDDPEISYISGVIKKVYPDLSDVITFGNIEEFLKYMTLVHESHIPKVIICTPLSSFSSSKGRSRRSKKSKRSKRSRRSTTRKH